MRLTTRDDFVARANSVHMLKYSYDRAVYKGMATKLTITCPEHGDFEQTAGNHLQGHGCSDCSGHATGRVRLNPVTHRDDGTSVLELVSKGLVLECFLDTTDYPLVAGYRWYAHRSRKTFYARAHSPSVNGVRTWVVMHQFITGAAHGPITEGQSSIIKNNTD